MNNIVEAYLNSRDEYDKLLKNEKTGKRNFKAMSLEKLLFNYHIILDDSLNLKNLPKTRKQIEDTLHSLGEDSEIIHLNDIYKIDEDDIEFAEFFSIADWFQTHPNYLQSELENLWKNCAYSHILSYLLYSMFLQDKTTLNIIKDFLINFCGWFNSEVKNAMLQAQQNKNIINRIANWFADKTLSRTINKLNTIYKKDKLETDTLKEAIVINNKNKNKLGCNVVIDNNTGWFKTEKTGDLLLAGKVDKEGLWKNFAKELNCKKEDITVTFTGEVKNKDVDKTYYHVSCQLPQLIEETEIEEDIEKHETLNPVLFNENEKLIPEIKDKLLEIAKDFTDNLDNDNIKYKLTDIKLVGSNASYNFTKDSDIDLHLVFDLDIYSDEEKQNMAEKIYDYAKSIWNKNHDVTIKGIPVEIYAETNNTEHLSIEDTIVEEIDLNLLTEGDYEKFKRDFINDIKKAPSSDENKPYIDIKKIYQKNKNNDNEREVWNCIFHHIDGNHENNSSDHSNHVLILCESPSIASFVHRLIHILSYTQDDSEVANKIRNKINEYKPQFAMIIDGMCKYMPFDEWWNNYGNILQKHAVEIINNWNSSQKVGDQAEQLFDKQDDNLQEAVIKSALTSNGIYSILNDDWIKKPIQKDIPEIDQEVLKKQLQPWLDSADKLKTIKDVEAIEKWLDTLYIVRRQGIKEGGEYSLANCIFKELRNLGILDEIKDLKKQLESKRLSLESFDINEQDLISEQVELDSRTRDLYSTQLAQLAHNQVILDYNGNFQIHLVKEADVDNIIRKIQTLDFVESVYKAFSRYDFSNINFITKLPSKYFTINGKVKL
jgi:predicted nucleotidyltransferase